MAAPVRIIGIDPGLRRTGWGIVDCDGTRLAFIACGTVASASDDALSVRLRALFAGLTSVVERWPMWCT